MAERSLQRTWAESPRRIRLRVGARPECSVMAENGEVTALVARVMVATDRSESSGRAVRWAAQLARTNGAELVLAQVLLPPTVGEGEKALPEELHAHAETALKLFGDRVAGMATRGIVVVDADPAGAIVELAQREAVDVLVVGNLGMAGRTKFLLGNIPNRISHNARCTGDAPR